MENFDIVDVLVWIVAAIVAAGGYYFGKTRGGPTASGTEFDDAITKARTVVEAAQQLWDSKQIPRTTDGKMDPRYIWAYDQLKVLMPGLTEEAYRVTLESAVFWLKQVVEQRKASAARAAVAERVVEEQVEEIAEQAMG